MKYLLLPLIFFSTCLSAQWIPIQEKHIVQLTGKERQMGLFDEGPRLFDREGKVNLKPHRRFHPTYQKLYQPQELLIKLNGKYRLDSVRFYDGAGKDSFEIYLGNPADWNLALKQNTDRYESWRSFELKGQSELILLRFKGPQAEIGEMYFYGERLAPLIQPLKNRQLRSPLTLEEFMGINAFIDDPGPKVEAVAGLVREYHNWDWHYPEGLKAGQIQMEGIRFAPAAAGYWDFDQYYADLKKRGLQSYPCLQGSPPFLASEFDHKPQDPDFPADDPQAYRQHSAFIWQYAARYGSQIHESITLNLAKGQAQKSGLKLIDGLESWNEPDKWWRGREGYFHPFECAAMLSADFDGHAGTLGPLYGLKQADPNLDFVMGGLAGLDTNYIEAIRLWALYRRPKGNFPADVLNFHHYSNDAGGQDDRADHGIPPEDDHLKQRLEALVQYRNANLPAQKIFLSEFGYDTNPRSIQAPAHDDSLEVLAAQANYLVRSMLLAHASGIDGAFIYMLRDVNAPNPNKYMSSGLTAEKWNKHRPKPSFYKLKALKQILGEFVFVEQEQPELKELHIFRYRHRETGQRAYVLWVKSDGRKSTYKELYFLNEKRTPSQVYRLPSDASSIEAEEFSLRSGFEVNNSPVILIYD